MTTKQWLLLVLFVALISGIVGAQSQRPSCDALVKLLDRPAETVVCPDPGDCVLIERECPPAPACVCPEVDLCSEIEKLLPTSKPLTPAQPPSWRLLVGGGPAVTRRGGYLTLGFKPPIANGRLSFNLVGTYLDYGYIDVLDKQYAPVLSDFFNIHEERIETRELSAGLTWEIGLGGKR